MSQKFQLFLTPVKGNSRSITRSPKFALFCGFLFLLSIQFLLIRNWHVDIPNKYQHFVTGVLEEKGNDVFDFPAPRRELPIDTTGPKCHPQPAESPVHVAGSARPNDYRDFDFESFPGSMSRAQALPFVAAEGKKREKSVVTIVTPTNNPEYLDETANSLFLQSFGLFDWIIVNDHSTYVETLTKYRNHPDSRITVIDCDSGSDSSCGPSKARNTGLAHVKTEYVVFLDDDDLVESTYLEKLVWFLQSNKEFSYANTYSVTFGEKTALWDRTFYQSSLTENQQVITALIRTQALRDVTDHWPIFFEENMTEGGTGGSEDWMMWLKLKANHHDGATVPEYLFWYRMKPKRRNWEFLSSDDESSNQHKTHKTTAKFGPKVAAELFPELYENGHKNPTIDSCASDASPSFCSDIFEPAPFENIQEEVSTLKGTEMGTPICENDFPRKHIILVLPWMAMGGSDMVNVKLVKLLSEENWKITIVNTLSTSASSSTSSSLEFFRPLLQQYTEDIFTLPHFLRVKDYGKFFRYLLKSRNADVMMTSNSFAGYHLLPYLKSHAPKVAFVDYVHMRQLDWKLGAYFERPEEVQGGGYPRFSGLFSKSLDLSLFVSDDERQWVAKEIMHRSNPKDNQQVVHYGLDTQKFSRDDNLRRQVRQKYGLAENDFCVVFVGRLVDQKRPDVLIKIFDQLKRKFMDRRLRGFGSSNSAKKVHLLVAGDGELMPKLEEYVRKNNLESSVSLLGRVERSDMKGIMSAGDAIFLPSKMEGLAIALIEAMSMGLVPVVTNVGGHREIVLPGTGCLLDRDDEDGMLKCLSKLAKNPSLLQSMRKESMKVVQNEFSFQSMKAHIRQHLSNVMEKVKSRSVPDSSAGAAANDDLPKILQAIRLQDPEISTLYAALNVKNVPSRKTEFGQKLANLCGEDAATMTSWISMMEAATMENLEGVSAAKMIGEHITKQCGQWCIYHSDDPDNKGWLFNGRSFTPFTSEDKDHVCHGYMNLKKKLKGY